MNASVEAFSGFLVLIFEKYIEFSHVGPLFISIQNSTFSANFDWSDFWTFSLSFLSLQGDSPKMENIIFVSDEFGG